MRTCKLAKERLLLVLRESSSVDIDGDGVVAFSDFLILSSNFGQEVDGHRLGDIDCDGAVRFSDFLILADNFGDTPNESVSVPEASSKLLIPQLFLFLLLYQRTGIGIPDGPK